MTKRIRLAYCMSPQYKDNKGYFRYNKFLYRCSNKKAIKVKREGKRILWKDL